MQGSMLIKVESSIIQTVFWGQQMLLYAIVVQEDLENLLLQICLQRITAKDAIQKKDKQRASYYNYYTSKKWGDSRSYHLTLDSSALGIDKCVEMILQYRALYLMK